MQKIWVRFGFVLLFSVLSSVRFGSIRVRLFDGFEFNCTSVITKSFNAICKLMYKVKTKH